MSGAADVLAAVEAAADRGAPLRPRDLLKMEASAVRGALDAGDIVRVEMRHGRATEIVILPGVPVDEDDSGWSDDELAYLETAYCGGVSFAAMAAALKRPGGDILQAAWRNRWNRGQIEADNWGSEIPAWRIARFRAMLDEAELRGEMAGDDGADLTHRALRRRFEMGVAGRGPCSRHFHPWSAAEVGELSERYDNGETLARIARALRRTKGAISSKLNELDMARCVNWTLDEDRVVVSGVARGLNNNTISTMLPGRSRIAVKVRARQLCGPRGAEIWSEAEKDGLREACAAGANLRHYARKIGRGTCGVRWQCKTLGLTHPRAVVPYGDSEDRRIRAGYQAGEKPREIAADLGRPVAGVFNRAFKLGLTKGVTSQRRPWRHYEVEYIRVRVAQDWSAAQIAERLCRRGVHAVYRIAHKRGIHWARSGPKRNTPEAAE